MERRIETEITVDAPLEDVWHAWTTTEGVVTFFAPKARVDLRIGGPFEIYFDPEAEEGSRGSEGCRVLSYLPMEMFSFEWNAPPSIPALRNANMRNWVVVQFYRLGEKQTGIRIVHQGWGEGEDWDKCFEYFSKAWPFVLENCLATGSMQCYIGEKGSPKREQEAVKSVVSKNIHPNISRRNGPAWEQN